MPKKSRGAGRAARQDTQIESEALEPIRVVERELTGPDGTVQRVQVPVYPPFRLKARPERKKAS